MPRELVAAEGPDASVPVEADNAAPSGVSVAAVVAAEAEERLDAAFFKPERWWVGELPGLGVMRLPLPE